ncbi:substrate-binding periplasmic protein [Undibacterium sp. RuRC25W]|uniref:substrate-binding periplasmic protein n=1 Tax=Undibacterium sp. RuRC25W TaxID=3413047 RepID=UPI003BF106A8
MRLLKITLLVFSLLATSLPARSEQLVIYAEDARPFGYLKKDNVSSPTSDYIRALASRAGYEPEVRLMSWAGIMHTADSDQPVIFFPLARTRDRESKYQWIGTLARFHEYHFYKLRKRTDIQVKKLSDAKNYRIGVIEADAKEEYLINNDFRYLKQTGLIHIIGYKEGMRLLQVGRLDLLPLSIENFKTLCSPNCDDFEIAYKLNLDLNLEVAANKATPQHVILRLRKAYESLEKEGKRTRVLTEN